MFFGGLVMVDDGDFEKGQKGATLIGVSAVILILEYYDVVKTATKYNIQLYKDLFGEEPKMETSFIQK